MRVTHKRNQYMAVLLFGFLLGSTALADSIRFEEVTDVSGLSASQGTLFAWGDINRDGNVDLLAGSEVYLNLGEENRYRFEKANEKLGLSELNDFGTIVDLNGDQRPDIVARSGQIWIQQNDGSFVDRGESLQRILKKRVTAIALFDSDNDGDLDLFATQNETSANGDYQFHPPQMIRNDGQLQFTDISEQLKLDQFPNYGRGIAVMDFDLNGTQDFYLSNYRLRPNDLFVNSGPGSGFQNGAKVRGVEGEFDPGRYYDEVAKESFGPNHGHTIGSTWGDFDNDGYFDLWVSNLVHKYVGPFERPNQPTFHDIRGYVCDDSKIYKNMGPPYFNFSDMRDMSGIPRKPIGPRSVFQGDELWSHAITADFDNDGLLDVYVPQIYNSNYSYSLLYRNLGDFKFRDAGAEAGTRVFDTYGGAWADVNNDGSLDLVTAGRRTNGAEIGVHLFLNQSANENHFLRIRLKGYANNSSARGAIVSVTTQAGKRVTRGLEGGTGAYNQQNESVLHFGLGNESEIRSIMIQWPSGRTQQLDAPGVVDTLLDVVEPQ